MLILKFQIFLCFIFIFFYLDLFHFFMKREVWINMNFPNASIDFRRWWNCSDVKRFCKCNETKTVCLPDHTVIVWHVVLTHSSVETADRHTLSHDHLSLFGHFVILIHTKVLKCVWYFKVTIQMPKGSSCLR